MGGNSRSRCTRGPAFIVLRLCNAKAGAKDLYSRVPVLLVLFHRLVLRRPRCGALGGGHAVHDVLAVGRILLRRTLRLLLLGLLLGLLLIGGAIVLGSIRHVRGLDR